MYTFARLQKASTKQVDRLGLKIGQMFLKGERKCPACGATVLGFFRYGNVADWGCPECNASPRERLVNYLLQNQKINLGKTDSILHIAPSEKSLEQSFRARADKYDPVDLFPDIYPVEGIRKLNLMEPFGEASYDVVYASHVMEHVPDDAKVLRNIFKALKPGGQFWMIVPLWDKPTEDGPDDLSPKEREKRFGQWDHVRQYGLDVVDRANKAGFSVEAIDTETLPQEEVRQYGLGEILFVATKPATN